MTVPSLSCRFALLLLLTGCGRTDAEPLQQVPRVIAITDVAVIPMDSERVLPGQTVLIRDGRIAAIGPASTVPVPPDAQEIAGSRRYLIPGLVDFHVHLRDPSELLSYLAHGVTTVVQVSGGTANVPDVLDLRGQVARGEVPGPTIYTTGRILDGAPAVFPGVSTPVSTPEEARATVEAQVSAGVDFIKVYNNLSTEALRAAIAASHERHVAVIGHIPRRDGRPRALQEALGARLDLIAHGEEYFFTFFYGDLERQLREGRVPILDERRIPEAVRLTLEAGAAVSPNLAFVAMTRAQLDDLDRVLADPEVRFLTPAVLRMWRQQNPTTRRDLAEFDRREQAKHPFLRRLTLALSNAGVPLLLGTDASVAGLLPGKSAHVELLELVQSGLTPFQALSAGTRTAGAFLQTHTRTDPVGTVAIGSRADLVLLRGNPLENIANADSIEGVLTRGRWLPKDVLHDLRVKARDSLNR